MMRNLVLALALIGIVTPGTVQAEDETFATRKIGTPRAAKFLSAVFPGLGQLSTGRRIAGTILVVSEMGALATTLTANENYKTRLDNFARLKVEYEEMSAGNSEHDIAQQRWSELTKEADDLDNLHRIRRVFAGVALGVYVYSMLDILLWDPPVSGTEVSWNLRAVPGARDAPTRLMIAGRF
jgi:hypothetical protein